MNLRRLYEKHYGKLPKGTQVHHVIPRHAGGTDDITNLVALTVEDHANAHLARYKIYGDKKDLAAAKFITYDADARSVFCSIGGKIGGKMQKENGIGIHSGTYEDKKRRCLAARKIQIEKNANRFINATSEEQSSRGKRGGVKNKGFRWYFDGENNQKYTPKQQQQMSFDDFMLSNPTYTKGRKK